MEKKKKKAVDPLAQLLENATQQELEEVSWLMDNPAYEEKPVDIKTFVNSPNYLDLEFKKKNGRGCGCRPRILQHLINIYDSGKKYDEFVFVCGIGWGKDFTASIILTYEIYKLACLKSPTEYYGLASGSSIHLMLMSISETHARDVLFGEVTARIAHSPWFRKKFMYDKKLKTVMKFPKNIILIPGNSKETTFVGYNIFCGIQDEGDDYLVTPERDSAEEGYNAIKDRILSRFRGHGMQGMIGSPKTVEGFMMRKYENIEGVPNRYRAHVPTWDSLMETDLLCGETFKYKDMVIPIEYQNSFKADPERALKDLGARPAFAKQPFITLLQKVNGMFDDEELLFEKKKDGFSFASFKEGIKGVPGVDYYGHLDLAINRKKGDKLGFAIGHVDGFKNIDNITKPITRIDIAMVVTAPPGGEIILDDIKQYIYYLQENGFSFYKITADSWQSVDIMQSLKARGIKTDVLSVDRTMDPYNVFKESIYEDRVKCHEYELLKNEMKRLELVGGDKIDHPKGFSKDCADAVAGVIYNIYKSNTSRVLSYTPSYGSKREF